MLLFGDMSKPRKRTVVDSESHRFVALKPVVRPLSFVTPTDLAKEWTSDGRYPRLFY